MKSRGPRTEPWGTPHEVHKDEGVITSDTEGATWHIKRKLNTFLTTLIDGSEKEVESTKNVDVFSTLRQRSPRIAT